MTGSITAVGAAWNTLIVAEYFSLNGKDVITSVGIGIGKMIVVATNDGDISTLTLAILTMTAADSGLQPDRLEEGLPLHDRRYAYNR